MQPILAEHLLIMMSIIFGIRGDFDLEISVADLGLNTLIHL